MRIEGFAPLMADQFPAWSFTESSLQAVARATKFFPSYAELTEALSTWVREHRPPPSTPLLTGPKGAELDSEAAVWVRVFRSRLAERGPKSLGLLISIARASYPEAASRAIEAEFGTPRGATVHVRTPSLHRVPGADRREAGEPPPPVKPRQSQGPDW
jgi:hypothetical protein